MVKSGEGLMRLVTEKKLYLLAAAALILALCLRGTGEDMLQEELRISRTLSEVAGAGRVRVSVYFQENGTAFGSGDKTIVGAVAVCEGAGDIAVRLEIAQALETLLGLEADQVFVLKMEDEK